MMRWRWLLGMVPPVVISRSRIMESAYTRWVLSWVIDAVSISKIEHFCLFYRLKESIYIALDLGSNLYKNVSKL